MRRLVSFTAVAACLPLWALSAPLWVPITALADVFGRLWRFPTVRLGTAFGVYLIHECIGMIVAVWLWLRGGFGRRLDPVPHRRMQGWWATSLLRWADRLLGVRLDIDDLDRLPQGDFIVLSRHASMADAILPARLIAGDLDRFVHYVLKRELRWDPNIDLYGSRLGNYFVTRGADTEREAFEIERMADRAEPDSGLVIFPEGTYATPKTRRKVMESLARRADAAVVARAERLQHLLPPKPAGTLAMLAGRPEADVVVFGHVGLEGVASLKGLRRRLPLAHPVIVRWWIHRRADLPTGAERQAAWLADQWDQLDQWVAATGSFTAPSPG